jgi:hypothetical protein
MTARRAPSVAKVAPRGLPDGRHASQRQKRALRRRAPLLGNCASRAGSQPGEPRQGGTAELLDAAGGDGFAPALRPVSRRDSSWLNSPTRGSVRARYNQPTTCGPRAIARAALGGRETAALLGCPQRDRLRHSSPHLSCAASSSRLLCRYGGSRRNRWSSKCSTKPGSCEGGAERYRRALKAAPR